MIKCFIIKLQLIMYNFKEHKFARICEKNPKMHVYTCMNRSYFPYNLINKNNVQGIKKIL